MRNSKKKTNFAIVWFVVFSHLFVLFFCYQEPKEKIPISKKKISVQTIKLRPPSSEIAMRSSQQNDSIKKNPPPKVEIAKKEKPKKTQEIKPIKKIEVESKNKNVEERKKLIAEALNALADMDKDSSKKSFSKISLSVDALNCSEDENDYKSLLVQELRNSLQLPELGKVEILLTINREGKCIDLKILSSESNRNKNYIENVLPTLTFSPFGINFKGKKIVSFPITLTNE